MDKVYLILASGDVFEGTSIGAKGETVGEVVFTTAMTGYLETITDPSYYGQIVVQTFPLIGNVGVIPEDFESSGIRLKGYIVRDLCEYPSNFRCKGSLGDFLKEQGVIGIQGIDTRHLTKIVRERGVMNGIITSSPKLTAAQKKALEEYSIKGAVQETSCKKSHVVPAKGEKKFRVALVDYGSKSNIERELVARGCEITVFPCSSKAEDILKGGFDGIIAQDLIAGNTLVKSWLIHAHATTCGAVVGAKVPIALTSRSAKAEESFLSLVFCAVLNEWRKTQQSK